eukprot:tig00021616_g22920.t1
MDASELWFTGERSLEIQSVRLPEPGPGQVLVKAVVSAISSGTELLVYRQQVPTDMSVDSTLESLGSEAFKYPLKYGYSMIGRVARVGEGVSELKAGDVVFSFQPHQSAFVAEAASLQRVPEGVAPEDAAFLPNMETAVNFIHDGRPALGEQVAVFGAGVVGLLTTALLARFPLASLVAVDGIEARRAAALAAGATAALAPEAPAGALQGALRGGRDYAGADLAYEVSGAPAALDAAVAACGYSGRLVIGSWYGQKKVTLNLGGAGFHRGHLQLISSQVSSIPPELSGRWSKARRFGAAWEALREVRPAGRFVTHRVPFARAAEAYRLLDERPCECIQVLLTYE